MIPILNNAIPKISITNFAYSKLKQYARLSERRITIIGAADEGKDNFNIVDFTLPPQSVTYEINKATYEEINDYTGVADDEEFGKLNYCVIVRNTLASTLSPFTEKDFKYFTGLTELEEFIVGEVSKDGVIVFYYVNLENTVAYVYGIKGVTYPTSISLDGTIDIVDYNEVPDSEIKKEIDENCKYSYSSTTAKSTTTTNSTAAHKPKSELNKNNPTIDTLV